MTRLTRGVHVCELCTDRERPPERNGEVHVTGADGTRFAAPALVYHYVAVHRYAPPRAFIDAVLHAKVIRPRDDHDE